MKWMRFNQWLFVDSKDHCIRSPLKSVALPPRIFSSRVLASVQLRSDLIDFILCSYNEANLHYQVGTAYLPWSGDLWQM
jgi:hypothetical protein